MASHETPFTGHRFSTLFQEFFFKIFKSILPRPRSARCLMSAIPMASCEAVDGGGCSVAESECTPPATAFESSSHVARKAVYLESFPYFSCFQFATPGLNPF